MLSALATEPCQDEAPLPQSPHAAASNIQLLTRRWALALGMSCDFGKSTQKVFTKLLREAVRASSVLTAFSWGLSRRAGATRTASARYDL